MAIKGTKVTVFNSKAFGFISLKHQKEVSKEVKLSALQIETDAKMNVPVDEGTLRKSIGIDFSLDGLNATVETKLIYANYIEYGYGNYAGYPYMRPAYEKERRVFIKRVKDIITK